MIPTRAVWVRAPSTTPILQLKGSLKYMSDTLVFDNTVTVGGSQVTIQPIQGDLGETKKDERVNHPSHYTSHPSGVECIEITRHYDYDIGNAIKYLWRAGLKTEDGYSNVEKEIEDLEKAIFYINDRIKMLKGEI